MSGKQKRQSRTVIRVDTKKLAKHFARLAEGHRKMTHNDVLMDVVDCVYLQKGKDRRSITLQEAAQFIKTGTIKPTQERSA